MAAWQTVTFPEKDENGGGSFLIVMPISSLSGIVHESSLSSLSTLSPTANRFSFLMEPFCTTVHNNLRFSLTEDAALRLLYRDGAAV
jgi:hypothetical protein